MFISNKIIAESGIQFGTSGARGLAVQFTPQACAAFTHAFLASIENTFQFKQVAIAIDNRPSSYAMAQACVAAIQSLGYDAVYYGVIPTPALAYSAMQAFIPCIMVTGSHIPFDRNGLKFYRPDGEITKRDEQNISNAAAQFSALNTLPKLEVNSKAAENYIKRYTQFFEPNLLQGKRIGIYEHSSAGRDLYQILFELLGAEVVQFERTDEFVPVDTEAVTESDEIKAREWSKKYQLDCIFSTDGDGDRPLVSDEKGEWLRGDILGLICAKALQIEALVIPISCNTIIESSAKFKKIIRTKIGSPYVIAELSALSERYNSAAGFEANGGFILGTSINIDGKVLKALPTRDAVLPALMLLAAAREIPISDLVNQLPKRYTHSDRIQNFTHKKSLSILEEGKITPNSLIEKLGFEKLNIESVDLTDGLRLPLSNGTIIHLRPSGNAPELRCYAEASTFEHAKKIVDQVLTKVKQQWSEEKIPVDVI